MSIETWKAEFYPRTAYDAAEEADVTGDVRHAIRHSLAKWRGLTSENRARHGVTKRKTHDAIEDEDMGFHTESSSCALCMLFNRIGLGECEGCPLDPCDSEFVAWLDANDPAPMIAALEAALARADDIAATMALMAAASVSGD